MNLTFYYQRICKFPKLTRQEEEAHIKIFKSKRSTEAEKQKAKDTVINSNLRFAFKQARYFSKNDPDLFEELIGAGNEGLIIGLEKFDNTKGIRFLSYAGHWVKQRILKQMSQQRIVSLPLYKQQLSTRIRKFQDKNGKTTLKQLKKEFPDASEKDLNELSGTRYLTYYIDDLEEEAENFNPILNSLELEMDNKYLRDIVYNMDPPYKEVLILTYGLEDGYEAPIAQVCKRLILTREQLKQIKKEALEILKEKLEE